MVVDTAFFKGNYPDRCALRAALLEEERDAEAIAAASVGWPILLPESKLSPAAVHDFTRNLTALGTVSHVRLDIYPDGGVSRLRLFGRIAP